MTRWGWVLLGALLLPRQEPAPVDAWGDPLPEGAIARLGSARFQHADRITGVAYSRDGTRVVASGWSNINAWNAADGRPVGRIVGRQGSLEAMAVSPDGRTVYTTGCNILHVIAWDVDTGKEKFRLQGPGDGPNFTGGLDPMLAISDDGKRLATSIRDDTLRVWDLEKRREILKKAIVDGDPIRYGSGIAISSDGRLVTATGAAALYVIEVDTGRVALKIDGARRHPSFSPDGKKIACGGGPGWEIWDLQEARRVSQLPPGTAAIRLPWTPDGRSIAWWDKGAIVIGDALTGDVRVRAEGQYLGYLDFSPDGRTLAAATGQTVCLIDAATGRLKSESDPASSIAGNIWSYSPDSRIIATTGFHLPIRFWDPRTGREVSRIELAAPLVAMAFSADGRTLATYEMQHDEYAAVRRFDVRTGRQIGRIELQFKSYASFSADGRWVISADGPNTRVVDVVTGALVRPPFGAQVLGFSPDSKRALLRKNRKLALVVWEPRTESWSIDSDSDSARFTPDGREVVVFRHGQARVLDAANGKLLREIVADPPGVESVYFAALSPGGEKLLTSSYDGHRVDHWDLAKSSPPQTFKFDERPGHPGFAPDGSSWATSMRDNTILVWKLKPDPPASPAPTDLDSLWKRLGDDDVVVAWDAARSMKADPGAARFLQARLKDRRVAPPPADEKFRSLVAGLDGEALDGRNEAERELRAAGAAAEAALLEGMDAKPGAETEARLRKILDAIAATPSASGDDARRFMALRVLGSCDDLAARDVLHAMKVQAPTWSERLAANEALERARKSQE